MAGLGFCVYDYHITVKLFLFEQYSLKVISCYATNHVAH